MEKRSKIGTILILYFSAISFVVSEALSVTMAKSPELAFSAYAPAVLFSDLFAMP